jgi:ankyrin repeat protein
MTPPQAGWSALHDAANRGHTDIVTELVRLGARLNDKTVVRRCAAVGRRSSATMPAQSGWSPVHLAASKGHVQTVTALVSLGASVHEPTNVSSQLRSARGRDESVLVFARAQAALPVRRVRPHLPVSLDFSHVGLTPLHCAAIYGQNNVCKELVRLRARVDDRNEVPFSPALRRLRCTAAHVLTGRVSRGARRRAA